MNTLTATAYDPAPALYLNRRTIGRNSPGFCPREKEELRAKFQATHLPFVPVGVTLSGLVVQAEAEGKDYVDEAVVLHEELEAPAFMMVSTAEPA